MKNFLLGLVCLSLTLSCGSNDQEQFDKDIAEIEAYVKAKGWNAQKTVDGIYYVIDEPGGAEKPIITDVVKVDYIGKFIDDSVFDQGSNVQFGLSTVIQGWQIGIPKFGKGGKGKLLIPSEYGYNDKKVRIFDITLYDF
jgi:FKBP-type peptidyl-prolyl cis-trans isomerase FkpA